jgi:hypothetical protein
VPATTRTGGTGERQRSLTQRDLNRALLARQQLIEPATAAIPTVLERMGGLQAQYAPAMYLGLWSRMQELRRDAVTEALRQKRVVQATLMRSTIHLVSTRDYWSFSRAIRSSRQEWFRRVSRGDPGSAELARAADTLRATFAADGPLRQTEIDKLITARLRRGVGHWLDMVRVPPSGTWERRRADLYLSADLWLGAEPELDPDQCLDLLVRRYLGGFGPSTPAEIADWAALPVAAVARALDRMALRTARAEDGTTLVDLPRAPLPKGSTPVPVRFLPVWDATLLVHARRTGILPERLRPRIFNTRTPHSFNTVLVDGAVVGTWRYEHDEIRVDEFEPLDPAVRREVRTASEPLAAFHR